MSGVTLGVLVAYYLFLAVRWDLVRRQLPYLVGVCAVGVVMLSGLFAFAGNGGRDVSVVFSVLAIIVAFGAGIAACCGAKLPIDTQSPPADEPEIL